MSGTVTASVVCALAAAILFAAASVAQQRSAEAVPAGESLVAALIRSPRWWAGVLGDGGGYLLQVAALALGPVLVVQPLLVSSLLFALPLSAAFSGSRITRPTWLTAAALCAALVVFLVVGDPTAGEIDAPGHEWVLPLGVVCAVVLAATAIGLFGRDRGTRALALGAASGLLYGVAVAFTKYVTDLFEHGLRPVAGAWQTWALVTAGLLGVYLQQRAFQAGPLAASLPAVTIGEPLAAVFLGMTVLDERLRVDGPGLALVVASVGVMLIATVALSRSQARLTAPAGAGA